MNGRAFVADDRGANAVVLGYDAWRRRLFDANEALVGGTLDLQVRDLSRVGPTRFTVLGVVTTPVRFPPIPPEEPPYTWSKWITGNYFETMQIPLLAGRPIDWSDVHARAPVAVVTANFAELYWGSPTAALGQRIRHPRTSNQRLMETDPGLLPWREIVGVVGNVRNDGVSQPAPTVIFWPMAQNRPPGLYSPGYGEPAW